MIKIILYTILFALVAFGAAYAGMFHPFLGSLVCVASPIIGMLGRVFIDDLSETIYYRFFY